MPVKSSVMCTCCLWLHFLSCGVDGCVLSGSLSDEFLPTSTTKIGTNLSTPTSTMLNASPKATLTPETTWRLRFSLNDARIKNGRKVGELFDVDVQFSEEDGYGTWKTLFYNSDMAEIDESKTMKFGDRFHVECSSLFIAIISSHDKINKQLKHLLLTKLRLTCRATPRRCTHVNCSQV